MDSGLVNKMMVVMPKKVESVKINMKINFLVKSI